MHELDAYKAAYQRCADALDLIGGHFDDQEDLLDCDGENCANKIVNYAIKELHEAKQLLQVSFEQEAVRVKLIDARTESGAQRLAEVICAWVRLHPTDTDPIREALGLPPILHEVDG